MNSMIRFLIILFVSGLLVCGASFAIVAALGFPKDFHLGGLNWTSGDDDGPTHNLGAPGPQGSREFAWSGDEDLTINVPAEVTYIQGPDAKVLVTGPQNWIDHIKVDDGDIGMDKGRYKWSDHEGEGIKITVTAPNVRNFELNGAQDMKIKGYNQDSFDLQVNGAARVRAEGKARTIKLEMNGAAKAELADLITEDAEVQLNGASSVVIAPTKSSDIEINGVGSAKLTTSPPTTHQEIHGFGSVRYGVARGDTDNDDGRDKAEITAPAPPAPPAAPVAPKQKDKAKAA